MNDLDDACLKLFGAGIHDPIRTLVAMTILMLDGMQPDKAAELMFIVDQQDGDVIRQARNIVELRKAVREE